MKKNIFFKILPLVVFVIFFTACDTPVSGNDGENTVTPPAVETFLTIDDVLALIDANYDGTESKIAEIKNLLNTGNVNAKDEQDYTALIIAAHMNYADIIDVLIQVKGIDVNIAVSEWTALMFAARGTHTYPGRTEHLESVKALLKAKNINIDYQENYMQTALIIAAIDGYTETVRALINASADKNMVYMRKRALEWAEHNNENGSHDEIIALLQ